jgi:DnaJ-class molecular chaperone
MYLGFKNVESTEQIQIPAGYEFKGDYFVYKLKNKGNEFFYKKLKYNKKLKIYEEIINQKTSHLFIKVKINDHDYFKRDENNIITENYISITQYILGGKLNVSTIYGQKEINIIAYEDHVIIKKYGVNQNGDHIVKLNIKLPKEINKEQFKIYSELKKYDI